jgi:hypothetical protein
MNRIFSAQGDGWPEFPRKAFARLDQTEPVDPREWSSCGVHNDRPDD